MSPFPTDVKGFGVSKKLDKVGNLASDTADPLLRGLPRSRSRYLLGEENQGFYHIMTNFQGERLVAAIGAVAGMEHMVEDADALRAASAQAFGRPILKFQVWRHKFVEHLAAIEAAQAAHLPRGGSLRRASRTR